MDEVQNFTYTPQSQPLLSTNNHQSMSNQTPPHITDNGFPIIAIVVLCITATCFLLISYYIFVTKWCSRWQHFDPLRRFRTRFNEDPHTAYSPSWQNQGLDESLIRQIPTFQYRKSEGEFSNLSKCVVCLNEFHDRDVLRVLPRCTHAFHLDCIDVWLQTNSNCPLCRSTISGRNRYKVKRLLAPNSSPQDPLYKEDFVVIELGNEERTNMSSNIQQERIMPDRFLAQPRSQSSRKFLKSIRRKFIHSSIMGDEGIDLRGRDDQFFFHQPIRRSFSMDSAVDRHVYMPVQEIMRHNMNVNEVRSNGESTSKSLRHIFSFGNGRGSRNSVLPVEF